MKLDVVRFQNGVDATNGLLFVDGVFECYTLEDEYRDVKVMHETCIPEGTYNIEYRTVGGFHAKYTSRYGDFHKGMLWIKSVPGFEYILIHSGNTDQHTSGCLIVGETQTDLDRTKDGFIGNSGDAYKKVYKKCSEALDKGEELTVTYSHISDALEAPLKISELRGQIKILEAEKTGKFIT
tara:strand:- start:333 stop:875 length:543 start_codon:yes stop_codon:yes gene_type:complete